MALTRITKGVIKPNENYDTHNINSTGIVTAVGANFTGDVNVGGVLTYEDVTSIDSVGIITAQKGIHIGAGVSAVGVGTFGSLDIGGDIDVDGHTNLDNVSVAGVSTFASNVIVNGGISNAQYLNLSALAPSIDFNDTNHNSDFMLQNANGLFKLYDNTNTVDRVTVASDGKVSVKQDLDVDGHTNLDNVSIAGVTTFSDHINLPDNKQIKFGNSADFKIEHNTNENYIDSNSGHIYIRANVNDDEGDNIYIQAKSGENSIVCNDDGGVQLYYNNVEKAYTNSQGLYITNTGFDAFLRLLAPTGYHATIDMTADTHANEDNYRIQVNTDQKFRVYGKPGGNYTSFIELDQAGQVTLTRDLDVARHLSVDGHTNLDNVSIAGITTTNQITISSSGPRLTFSDSNENPDFYIEVNASQFLIQDATNNAERFRIQSNGVVDINGNTNFSAGIDVTGGPITSTGIIETTGSEIKITGAEPRLTFTDTDNNPDFQIWANAQKFAIYDSTNSATRLHINSSGKTGINATNPQSMFEVLESSTTQSETDKRIAIFRKNGTAVGDEGYIHLTTMTGHYGVKLGFANEGASPGYLNQGFFISTVNSGENITNHTKKFVIKSDGRISAGKHGVGTHNDASEWFKVQSNDTAANISIVGSNDTHSSLNLGDEDDFNIQKIKSDHTTNSLQFFTNNQETLRIDGNNKVIVASGQVHSSRVLAKFGIDCHGLNIYDNVASVANYGLAFYNDPNTNYANGIGFFNDDGQTCGGYIVHQDKGGSNIGDIIMACSQTAGQPEQRLRLHYQGGIQINSTVNVSPFVPNMSGSGLDGGLVLTTPAYSEYHFTWSGQSSATIDVTCGSYFHSEFTYVQHQTNGGVQMHSYARGKWANNHTTHTGFMYEFSGGGSGLNTSFTVSDQSGGGSVDLKSGLSTAGAPGAAYLASYHGGNENTSSSANGRLRINEVYQGSGLSVGTRALIIRVYFGSFAISKS